MLSISEKAIRNYSRHCFRFMDGYRKELKGPLLDFAMKKYKSHRAFSANLNIDELSVSYKLKYEL
jgi:hypothetical protein